MSPNASAGQYTSYTGIPPLPAGKGAAGGQPGRRGTQLCPAGTWWHQAARHLIGLGACRCPAQRRGRPAARSLARCSSTRRRQESFLRFRSGSLRFDLIELQNGGLKRHHGLLAQRASQASESNPGFTPAARLQALQPSAPATRGPASPAWLGRRVWTAARAGRPRQAEPVRAGVVSLPPRHPQDGACCYLGLQPLLPPRTAPAPGTGDGAPRVSPAPVSPTGRWSGLQ